MQRVSVFLSSGVVLSLIFLHALSPTKLLAQSQPATPSISIATGDILELTIDTPLIQPTFSWILSKDHRFIGAQRSRFFQTRQTDSGLYTLDVNIQDAARTHTEYHSLHIDVRPLQHDSFVPIADRHSPPVAHLASMPPAVNGTVRLSPLGNVLQLQMEQSKGRLVSYDIDLDAERDSDGDGNPSNDRDTQGTYSQQAGTPIFLLMQPQHKSRTITLTVQDASGAIATDRLLVSFDTHPLAAGQTSAMQRNGDFLVTHHDLTVSLSLDDSALPARNDQLLYEWHFGDKTSSLHTEPLHRYAASGAYTVSLIVRNILNGRIIYTGSTEIFVSPSPHNDSPPFIPALSSSAGSNPSASDPPFAIPPVHTIVSVGFIVLSLIAFALLLFFVFLRIKRKTSGALQRTIEKMEQEIFEPTKQEILSSDIPSVMPLKKASERTATGSPDPEIIERELAHADFQSSATHDTAPSAGETGPVPDWLAHAPSSSALPSDSRLPAPIPPAPSPASATPVEPPPPSLPATPPDAIVPPSTPMLHDADASPSPEAFADVGVSGVSTQHSLNQSAQETSSPPSTLSPESPAVSPPLSANANNSPAPDPPFPAPNKSHTEGPSPAAAHAPHLPSIVRSSSPSTPPPQSDIIDHPDSAAPPLPESSSHTSTPSATAPKEASSPPALSARQGNPPPSFTHTRSEKLTPTQRRRLRRRRKREKERMVSQSSKLIPSQGGSTVPAPHSLAVDNADTSRQKTVSMHDDETVPSDSLPPASTENSSHLPSLSDTNEQSTPSSTLQNDQSNLSPKIDPPPLATNQPIATTSMPPSSSHAGEEQPLFVISADSLNENFPPEPEQ